MQTQKLLRLLYGLECVLRMPVQRSVAANEVEFRESAAAVSRVCQASLTSCWRQSNLGVAAICECDSVQNVTVGLLADVWGYSRS